MCENVTIESHGTVYESSQEPWMFLPKAPRDQAWLDAALADAPVGKEGFFYELGGLYYLFGAHTSSGLIMNAGQEIVEIG